MFTLLLPRLLNILLRALSLGSRFVLIFMLAKLLEPVEVGRFGLFLAVISFSVLLLGGDFYTYSHRKLLSCPRARWSFVIQHHLLALGLLYLLLLPLHLLLFLFQLLPTDFMLWFLLLLVVEHITQEMNRLLVVMQHQLLASWVLFLRMGLWVWVLIPLLWWNPESRHLETVFACWLAGGLAAILLGAIVIIKDVEVWRRWPLDRSWLLSGFRIGLLFLVATLTLKALFTVDRFLVDALVGDEMLGVYVLYAGMAMAVFNFLDPAVFSFLYPRLLSAYQRGEFVSYQKLQRELFWSTLLVSGVLALLVALLAPWVLEWIGREIYLHDLPLLWILLLVVVVYALGMVPHYGLYAKSADRAIVGSHLLALGLFLITTFCVQWYSALMAVPLGLLVAFAGMALFKWWRDTALSLPSQISVATEKVLL